MIPALKAAAVKEYGKKWWVAEEALRDAGYEELSKGDVVRLTGRVDSEIFVELEVFVAVDPADGGDVVTGWQVKRIDPSQEFADLPITAPDDDR